MQTHATSRWSCGLATALLLGLAGPASSQVNVNVNRGPALKPGATTNAIKLSTLLKSKVLIQQDQAAGQVVDVILSEGGCVEYFVASYDDQYYLVPYSAGVWRQNDNVVFIDLAPAQFKKVQFFANNKWPDFSTQAYRTTVFTTFGVQGARNDAPRATFKPDAPGTDADAKNDPKSNPITSKPRAEEVPKGEKKPDQPRAEETVKPRSPTPAKPGTVEPAPKPEVDRKPIEKDRPRKESPKKDPK